MVTVKILQNNISYLPATVNLQKSISYENRYTRDCYYSCCSSWWWAWGCPKHVELYL